MNSHGAILFVALLASLCGSQASAADPKWGITGSGTTYQVDGSGDPRSEQGARVLLTSANGDASKFGASYMVIDAAPYRGRGVALTARLSTKGAADGAGIWLRADDERHRIIAFMNSQAQLVSDSESGPREVEIDVPAAAKTLIFGTFLDANGAVDATGVRLTTLEPIAIPADATPQSMMDAAIEAVRANALNSRNLDWSKTETEIRSMARDAKVPADVYPAIRQLLAELGDHHSMLIEPRRSRAAQDQGAPLRPADVSVLPGGPGYIAMPGYRGLDRKAGAAFADDLAARMDAVAESVRCGWIVDLRSDTGGNMWPMLAALKPLLGDENLGSFEGVFGRSAAWRAGDRVDKTKATAHDLSHVHVAVLIGPHTASSGEAVAIAFGGRPDTRSFGAPTAGLTNGNGAFALPDGSTMMLASVVELDRTDRAYVGRIDPDVAIAASGDGADDAVLVAASRWLQEGCPR
jgi:hypothetical protein